MPNMHYINVYSTDVGIKKTTNEDSLVIMQAEMSVGPVLLAAVCDGMGGLSRGELASATAVKGLRSWFTDSLPLLLEEADFGQALGNSWNDLVHDLNHRISLYGRNHGIHLGTTIAAVLLIGQNYYLLNVGDSRVYLLADQAYQLTHDQTLVQQEVDEGKLTPEGAEVDPRRSVLLQCVGASPVVIPDFFAGQVEKGQRLLVCCDGFRHIITASEIHQALCREKASSQKKMQKALDGLVQLNKKRGEVDNITAILIDV